MREGIYVGLRLGSCAADGARMSWWWSRNHCIEPVRPHVSMPTVNTTFVALRPQIFPSKPRPPVVRLPTEPALLDYLADFGPIG